MRAHSTRLECAGSTCGTHLGSFKFRTSRYAHGAEGQGRRSVPGQAHSEGVLRQLVCGAPGFFRYKPDAPQACHCDRLAVSTIVLATLSLVGLRPKTCFPGLKRFSAFFLSGASFSVGYPRHRDWALAILMGGALLEACQLPVPDRDARVHDAVVKVVGGVVGMTLAATADHFVSKRPAI